MTKVRTVGLIIAFALVILPFAVQTASANPTTRKESLISFVSGRYDAVEGGYSFTGESTSRLESTRAAALILDDLGYLSSRPPLIDLLKMKNFTQKVQWKSGGESYNRYGGFASFIAGSVSTETTWTALQLWNMLGKFTDIPLMGEVKFNITAALIYINKTQTGSGGFGIASGSSPDIISTYYALQSLNLLLELKPDETRAKWLRNETKTVEWILSCRVDNSFKLSPNSSITGVTPTAAAVFALDALGQLSSLNGTSGVVQWMLDRQVSTSTQGVTPGGFEEGPSTNDTNLMSTLYAVMALEALNVLSQCNKESAAEFVADCQAADGSWGNVPGIPVGSLPNAGLAVEALRILGFTSLLDQEDPNNPGFPLLDWRAILVLGIVVVAAIVACVSLRMD